MDTSIRSVPYIAYQRVVNDFNMVVKSELIVKDVVVDEGGQRSDKKNRRHMAFLRIRFSIPKIGHLCQGID